MAHVYPRAETSIIMYGRHRRYDAFSLSQCVSVVRAKYRVAAIAMADMLKYFTVLSGRPEIVRTNRMTPIAKIAAMTAFIEVRWSRGVIDIDPYFPSTENPSRTLPGAPPAATYPELM